MKIKKTLIAPAAIFIIIICFTMIPLVARLEKKWVIKRFHQIYYRIGPHRNTSFLGIKSVQFPTDNWVMQEIISEVKPDFIIETGTGNGGTTLFYATVLEKVNSGGKIITVDIKPYDKKVLQYKMWDERVEFILGNSVSPEVVNKIAERVKGHSVLITLDSKHDKRHVLKELELYSPLVSLNSYIVVQDTDFGGNPVYPLNNTLYRKKYTNPMWAVKKFLKTHKDFEKDTSREKHLITQYPSGFLKRIKLEPAQ